MKNIGRLFFLRLLTQLITLGLIVLFTRTVGPSELGIYFFFLSVLGLTSVIATLGTTGAAEKRISQSGSSDTIYTTGLVITIVLSIVVGVGFFALNRSVSILEPGVAQYIIGALLVHRLFSYYQHVFRAELRAALGGVLSLCQVCLFGLSSLYFLQEGFGGKGVILAEIVAKGLLIPLGAVMVEASLSKPTISAAYDLLDYGKYYVVSVIETRMYYFADIFFIGTLLTTAAVGKYDVAWRIIMAGIFLNGVVARTAFSYISLADSKDDYERLTGDMTMILRYILILPFPILIGASILGNELLSTLFTDEYSVGTALFSIIALGFVFQSLYYFFNRILYGIDKPREAFLATLVGMISNLLLNPIFILQFGLIGAGAATTVSYLIAAGAYYQRVRKYIRIDVPYRPIIIQALSAVIMGVVILISSRSLPATDLAVVLHVALGGVVYFLLLWTIPETRADIKQFLIDVL